MAKAPLTSSTNNDGSSGSWLSFLQEACEPGWVVTEAPPINGAAAVTLCHEEEGFTTTFDLPIPAVTQLDSELKPDHAAIASEIAGEYVRRKTSAAKAQGADR